MAENQPISNQDDDVHAPGAGQPPPNDTASSGPTYYFSVDDYTFDEPETPENVVRSADNKVRRASFGKLITLMTGPSTLGLFPSQLDQPLVQTQSMFQWLVQLFNATVPLQLHMTLCEPCLPGPIHAFPSALFHKLICIYRLERSKDRVVELRYSSPSFLSPYFCLTRTTNQSPLNLLRLDSEVSKDLSKGRCIV